MFDIYTAIQSALAPHGDEAERIAEITWVLIIGGFLILTAVTVLIAMAVWRPRQWLAQRGLIIGGGVVLPVVVLSALLVYSLHRSPRLTDTGASNLVIEVVGHQWWWQVHYIDARGQHDFETANEIRIPVGAVVEIRLGSADVLHSLWIPALAGKLDMIPGKDNRLRVVANRAGVYRGQCAEYCGGAHGQMALVVVAHDDADFAAWMDRQRSPSRTANAMSGAASFQAHCAACHTVRGTAAEGRLGPDLTHVGSRLSLGAGILPNNPGTMAGWIADAQRIKPGNLMPAFSHLDSAGLRDLAAYLAALK